MTKSILRSVKQTLIRFINLSLAAIIGLSSLVAATPLLFSASASAATPTLAAAPAPCAVTGTPFLTITQPITNDPDSGNYGNWATDAFTENVSVWVGTDGVTYCANATANSGTFVTTGPLSPEHGLALPAGISGTFTGGENYTFTSLALSPSYNQHSTQTLTLPASSTAGFSTWVSQVFPSVPLGSGSNYVNTYSLTYVTPNGSTWTDADSVSGGDQGDVTPVYDSTSGIGYGTIQSAIDAASPGDTVVLGADMTISTQVNISKAITFDGTSHHLNAAFAKTSSANNAAIGITHSNVTIKNLVEDGTGSTNLHGINVFVSSGVVLNNVTVSHNGHSGLVVNGSNVTASSFNASNNGWNSVNVDPGSGVTSPSVFTLNSGTLSDSTQIWSDGSNVTGPATVTVNATGYTMYKTGGTTAGYSWTSRALTNAATITNNGVTTIYGTIIAAVEASQNGDTIKVAPGNYNLVKDDTTVISGQTGWYLPITKNNITLVGIDANGNEITNASNVVANIYSTQETANGSWSTQNLITVFGDNVTIQGLGIMNKIEPNKAIEVLGNNFKAVDNLFLPVPTSLFANASNYGGDDITKYGSGVYLNNNGFTSARTATITNNIFKNSGVTFDSFKDNWTVDVSSNTFDGNKIWVSGGVNYYYSAIGSTTWANQPNFTGSTINIHNNNFINMVSGQAYVKIKSSMTGSYNATNNYWGSVHPDFSSIVLGNVAYTPWYTNTIRTVLSNTLPVITLVGDSSLSIYQSADYRDAGATATDNQGSTVTVTTTNLPDVNKVGTYTVDFNAVDSFGNNAVQVTRTVKVLEKKVTQVIIAPTNTVSNASPQIVIGANAPKTSTITVPAGVTNASLDVAAILTTTTSGTKTATLSGGINVNSTTSAGQVTVALPAGTTITGAAGWDGTVNLPKIVNTTVTLPSKTGSTPTSVSSIEIGFGDVALNFSQPVRLVFAGKAGKQVGWSRSGVFSLITAVCTSDSVSGMPAGANECKIDVGADMAVWTKHFTTFTTYTQSSEYTVVAGDTLFSIGARASVDWRLIASNNNINFPYVIYPGQVLNLPSGTVVAAASTVTTPSVLGATSSPQVGTAISTVVGKTAVATSTAKASWFNWNWFYAGASIVLLAVIYYAYIANYKKNKP